MPAKERIPAQVMEHAKRQALQTADDEAAPPSPEKQARAKQRVKDKVVRALKSLHPMD